MKLSSGSTRGPSDTLFKASLCWMHHFLKRNNIQISVKLDAKGGDVDDAACFHDMEKIRELLSGFELRNVYNMDGSRLFYKIISKRTYLLENENRADPRGTSVIYGKERLTVVFCTNVIPIICIGKSNERRCFREFP